MPDWHWPPQAFGRRSCWPASPAGLAMCHGMMAQAWPRSALPSQSMVRWAAARMPCSSLSCLT
eukprot:1796235-Prorocentrum_lima.AAC.1